LPGFKNLDPSGVVNGSVRICRSYSMPGHPRLGVRIVVDAACFARVDPARDAAFDRGSGRGSRPGVPAGVRDRLAARGDRSARPRAPGSRAPSRRRSIFDFPLAFFLGIADQSRASRDAHNHS
jgi:hypothetical protein